MAKDTSKSAMERKADALEKSGGDPAKVNELRHFAPVNRSASQQSTANPEGVSNPTVKADEEYAEKRAEEAKDVADKEGVEPEELTVKGKTPRPKMNATRNI